MRPRGWSGMRTAPDTPHPTPAARTGAMPNANRPNAAIVCAAIAAIALVVALWPATGATPRADDRLQIVTTTGMLADAAQAIGGDAVVVTALMGPGVDPHLYKPSAGDIAALDAADVVIVSGLGLEGRMAEVLDGLAAFGTLVIVAADGLPAERLLADSAYQGHPDPHIWHDVSLWALVVRHLGDTLGAARPDLAATFRSHADAYAATLDTLDGRVAAAIATIPAEQRVLVTAHDAFAYFAVRYGIEVVALQGFNTAAEASARDVQALADLIVARSIPAIFVESSIPRATVEAVQAAVRARGHEVAIGGELFSDAMGDAGTAEGAYPGMIQHNLHTITDALAPAQGATT